MPHTEKMVYVLLIYIHHKNISDGIELFSFDKYDLEQIADMIYLPLATEIRPIEFKRRKDMRRFVSEHRTNFVSTESVYNLHDKYGNVHHFVASASFTRDLDSYMFECYQLFNKILSAIKLMSALKEIKVDTNKITNLIYNINTELRTVDQIVNVNTFIVDEIALFNNCIIELINGSYEGLPFH